MSDLQSFGFCSVRGMIRVPHHLRKPERLAEMVTLRDWDPADESPAWIGRLPDL